MRELVQGELMDPHWTDRDITIGLCNLRGDLTKPLTTECERVIHTRNIAFLTSFNIPSDWRKLWPRLKLLIDKSRDKRVAEEQSLTRQARVQLLEIALEPSIGALDIQERLLCPPASVLAEMAPLRSFVHQDYQIKLTRWDVEAMVHLFPVALAIFKNCIRSFLQQQLPSHLEGLSFMSPADLAVAVFECQSCTGSHLLFATQEVTAHKHFFVLPTVRFNNSASTAVTSILFALYERGRVHASNDYAPQDLDDLDPRLLCKLCAEKDVESMKVRQVMSWRHCVCISLFITRDCYSLRVGLSLRG